MQDDPRYRFIKGDVCDPGAMAGLVETHDAIVHMAAESHVDRSIMDAAPFVRTNCYGMQSCWMPSANPRPAADPSACSA